MMFLIVVILACPTLSNEVDGHVLMGDQFGSRSGIGDVPDDGEAFDVLDFLVIFLGNGEKELVVLAAVERVAERNQVLAYLLADVRGLVVDGDVVFVDFASAGRVFADVEQLAC